VPNIDVFAVPDSPGLSTGQGRFDADESETKTVTDSTNLPPESAAAHVAPVSEAARLATAVSHTPDVALTAAVSLPTGFNFGAVSPTLLHPIVPVLPPSLGPLAAFTGTFAGSGFNTIFRPDHSNTSLPQPVTGSDNLLELNLTSETLSFSPSLGSVPNRGMVQGDIFLNGVPYLQAVNDITSGTPVGIHLEPGLWVIAPATTNPAEGVSLARMASIPHGTTICAQGTASVANGAPVIPPISITPFFTSSHQPQTFQSQTAAAQGTARIPQDLTSFIAAGTITQAMLTDPNTFLRNHLAGQTITSTTTITISTTPTAPLFGGGTENIAFLVNNADAVLMMATFWIETVEHIIDVPIFKVGEAPLTLSPVATGPAQLAPKFTVHPPNPITTPRQIRVLSTQIQYSQTVMLNFNTLTWPHVSVATLVPSSTQSIPPSAWTA
jgi:hypothetical protein